MQQQTLEQFDLAGMVADLNNLLRLKTTVTGMSTRTWSGSMPTMLVITLGPSSS